MRKGSGSPSPELPAAAALAAHLKAGVPQLQHGGLLGLFAKHHAQVPFVRALAMQTAHRIMPCLRCFVSLNLCRLWLQLSDQMQCQADAALYVSDSCACSFVTMTDVAASCYPCPV